MEHRFYLGGLPDAVFPVVVCCLAIVTVELIHPPKFDCPAEFAQDDSITMIMGGYVMARTSTMIILLTLSSTSFVGDT
jgi:hypothetical protein